MLFMMVMELEAWVQEHLAFDFPETSSTNCSPVLSLGFHHFSFWLVASAPLPFNSVSHPLTCPGSLQPSAVSFLTLRNLSDTGGNQDPMNRVTTRSCSPASGWSLGPLGILSVLWSPPSHSSHQPSQTCTTFPCLTPYLPPLPLSRYRNSAGQ